MRLRALLLLALLLVPVAAAHLDHTPPRIQDFQTRRQSLLDLEGKRAHLDMLLVGDPLQHFIRYSVYPTQGRFDATYRVSASDTDGGFATSFRFDRLVEYRDVNEDLEFDPQIDTLVRQWSFEEASWSDPRPALATIQRVSAQTAHWQGRFAGGDAPNMTLMIAGGGSAAFTDEGAYILPQDMVVYLELMNFPARATGHLFALDGEMMASKEARVVKDGVDNTTTGIVMTEPRRFAVFQWGGTALVDGRERIISATLGEPRTEEDRQVRTFRLNLPISDERARFVIVYGVEYLPPEKGIPAAGAPTLVACAVAAAVGFARFRRAR